MKYLIVVTFTLLFSVLTNAWSSEYVWGPQKTIVGSRFNILGKTPHSKVLVKIQFYGMQIHSESFSFGTCKEYNSADIFAVTTPPFSEKEMLGGVHYDPNRPRIKGACRDSRDLINKRASKIFSKLKQKVASGPAFYKKYIERLIKAHHPKITSFKWVLIRSKQPPSIKSAKEAYNLGLYDLALDIWKPYAIKGDAQAQYFLGYMYFKGKGTHRDSQRAFYWFTKSANQGLSVSQKELGYMYYRGYGVKENIKLAEYWYLKAAKQGNVIAQDNLAVMYHFGEGLKKNYEKARYWWSKAAAKGYKPAQINLARSKAGLNRIIAIEISNFYRFTELVLQKILEYVLTVFYGSSLN